MTCSFLSSTRILPTVFSASCLDVSLSSGLVLAVEGGWDEAPTALVQSHSLAAMALESLPMRGSVAMDSL